MKAVQGLFAAMVALLVVAIPIQALAHDHDGWNHGHHWGWYKHHGYEGQYGGDYGYPGDWRHRDHEWYEHHGYAGAGYGGYPGNLACDEDGDDCGPLPVPPIAAPYSGYYGSVPNYGPGYYGSGYAPNMGKMMQLQQTMSQRLNANQALYQAAVAQGNYPLANRVAGRMQNQSATLNAANSMLNGGGVPGMPAYPGYNQPYGNPYYGQTASPLSSILQMFGY